MLHWISTISWPPTFQVVSTICRQTVDRIWLRFGSNSLWAYPGLINFRSCSTEFSPFPGLWYFLHIPDKPLIGFSSNLVGKLIMCLSRSDKLLIIYHWIPGVSLVEEDKWLVIMHQLTLILIHVTNSISIHNKSITYHFIIQVQMLHNIRPCLYDFGHPLLTWINFNSSMDK